MIITVVSFKGGVGKSTSVAHSAAYMQHRGPTDGIVRLLARWQRTARSMYYVPCEQHHCPSGQRPPLPAGDQRPRDPAVLPLEPQGP